MAYAGVMPGSAHHGANPRDSRWLRGLLAREAPELERRLVDLGRKLQGEVFPFAQRSNFTEHGGRHARNVQDNTARLIPSAMPEPLTPFEIFALLCAALLHDVGMITARRPNESISRVRVDHFNRSRDVIRTHHDALGFSRHEAEIIGEICRAHGMPNLDYLSGPSPSLRNWGEVRQQLLSAFLRLADILDVTADRAPDIVCASRAMPPISRRFWNLHADITDVQIRTEPSWDIVLVAMPLPDTPRPPFYELRNSIQSELDTLSPVLRSAGVYFKRVELRLTSIATETRREQVRNPFRLLRPFDASTAHLFAGRDRETQQMVEKVLGRRLVILIGESGVGKTSLVEAGVIPHLKTLNCAAVRFSFQGDPIDNLTCALTTSGQRTGASLGTDPLDAIRSFLKRRKWPDRLVLFGDHLEQLFTLNAADDTRRKAVQSLSRILTGRLPVTFLVCIREDHLPELYNLSEDLPEIYDRANTFRLYRLNEAGAIEAFERASRAAFVQLRPQLIHDIVRDLSDECDGMIYPPFLQIVGHRLYAAIGKGRQSVEVPAALYDKLGKVEHIVNGYLDGLLDGYPQSDKPLVGRLLGAMVTDFKTKKRVRTAELRRLMPECHNLDSLLNSLVQQRIVRRSLGEYELIHDFLALRVIEFVNAKRFLSAPLRRAIAFVDDNCRRPSLRCQTIANETGVSQAYLASLFREQLGCTLVQYVASARVAKAKEMLARGRDTIASVAAAAGFRSVSSFSRTFAKLEHISPLAFRKSLANAPSSRGRRDRHDRQVA